MFKIIETRKYIKDLQKIKLKLAQNVKLNICVQALKNGFKLDKSARCKNLHGEWLGYSEISIGWDLRVVFKCHEEQLELIRIGTHNKLFKKM